jgi:hypothetical protein
MAQITAEIRKAYGLAANLVPVDVLKQIDQSELLDRLVYADSLGRKARAASATPAERKGYAEQARNVMRAQPRAVTERAVADRICKASGLGSSGQADALGRSAQEILEVHPPAPRREDAAAVTVAKAAARDGDDLMVLYDADGRVFGVAPRSAVVPATTDPAAVAKARRLRRQ